MHAATANAQGIQVLHSKCFVIASALVPRFSWPQHVAPGPKGLTVYISVLRFRAWSSHHAPHCAVRVHLGVGMSADVRAVLLFARFLSASPS